MKPAQKLSEISEADKLTTESPLLTAGVEPELARVTLIWAERVCNPDFGILLSYLEGNKLIRSTRSVTLLGSSPPDSPMCGTQ